MFGEFKHFFLDGFQVEIFLYMYYNRSNINIDIVKTSLYKRQVEIGYTLFFFQMDLFIILAPPKSAGIFFFVLSFLPTLNHPAFF